jgi:CheY-like chemotaxis protein
MDGYEVARRLRREHVEPPMLLLAVTGYSDREALERSREAGFDHHLVKPVPLDTLLDLLAAHARRVAQRIGE